MINTLAPAPDLASAAPAQLQPRPSSDVMQQLKAATASTHKSVERKTPFFKEGFDRAIYVRWTRTMLGFYQPFELALSQSALMVRSRWAYAPRAALLQRDLQELGEPAHAAGAKAHGAHIPDVSDLLRAIGALYVVEGSALGGQVLATRIERTLGFVADTGASFYRPNGQEPRARWAEFQTLASNAAADSVARADIVEGAVVMFNAFDAWLVECGWKE